MSVVGRRLLAPCEAKKNCPTIYDHNRLVHDTLLTACGMQ